MATCILVLGVTRSGTSVVSGVLHRLGVIMGWELQSEDGKPRYDWPDPIPMNPLGFFQDAPVENVQDAMWGDDYPIEGARPTDHVLIEEYKRLVRLRVARGHPLWGIKASRNQWMIPEFLEACTDEVKFVVTGRTPRQSVESLRAWFPEYPESQCVEWVRRANQQIASVLSDPSYAHIPRLVLPFDDVHDRTRDTVTALAQFIGKPLTQEAVEFVKPELRRVR